MTDSRLRARSASFAVACAAGLPSVKTIEILGRERTVARLRAVLDRLS